MLKEILQAKETGQKELNLNNRLLNKNAKEIDEIFNEIAKLTNLTNLYLRDNQLTELPETVSKLTNLTNLDLSANRLTELPEAISKLTNLTDLYLSGNRLTELPETITKLTNLTYLYLNANQLTELPETVSKLTNLTNLYLSNNQLTELPETVSKLTNLTYLYLRDNQLTELPETISKLTNLTYLDLSANQLTELPETVTKLTNLTYFYLGGNRLTELPETISKLTNLTDLDLSANQLTELPETVSKLTNLTNLDLNGNQLTELPETITKLTNLTNLDLSANQLTELPETVTKLTNLTYLYLSYNRLTELPETVTKLTNLTHLDLSGNRLTELPETITKLTNLTYLYLNANQLTELPETVSKLTNLTNLYLSNNQLTELPETVSKLTNLTNLYLSDNQLTELPETISKLTNLTNLDLMDNQLTELPETVTKLTNLTNLYLSNNPIKSPPMAVVKQGIDAIRNYFEQIKAKGEDNLYHLKILLVGEPDAGKTSLMKRLTDDKYIVPPKEESEKSTVGIDIKEWNFKYNDTNLKVNLWDFGGQQIQYMIHHFFLTPESLYILVSDKRSETDKFDYWFNIISLLGKREDNKKAAVLVVENEIDIKSKNRVFDYNTYNKRYNKELDMPEPVNVNLSNKADKDKRFDALKEKIKRLVFDNKIPVPANWVNIKEELDKYKEGSNYINIDTFYEICKKFKVLTDTDCKVALKTFNNLGILNYYEDASLANRIFLNPKWITNVVYFILKESVIEDSKGRFTQDMLFNFLGNKYKQSEKKYLLNLMSKEHFEICYPIKDNNYYIAPQFLPDNKPDIFNDWNYEKNLRFQAGYSFMPEGIISRLIVRLNEYIEDPLVWKKGVVLNYKNTKAYICENIDIDSGKRFIDIRINGYEPVRKECLNIIRAELDKIHKKSFTGINCIERVACNCCECKEAKEPRFFRLKDLENCILKWTKGKRKHDMVSCIESGDSMSARDLLDGIECESKEKENMGGNTIYKPTYNVGGDFNGDTVIGEGAINKNNPNIEDVLKILPSLIKKLKDNAKPEDFDNIKIMEEAQKAAKNGDEPKARRLLSKAKNWILNTGGKIASDVSVAVITNYLKLN